MQDLTVKHCIPCSGNTPKLSSSEITTYSRQLNSLWSIVEDHHLTRHYDFDDFKSALAFTNALGDLAEAEGHHPDIFLAWGKVEITLFTHAIDGLSEADFILAAKIDQLK